MPVKQGKPEGVGEFDGISSPFQETRWASAGMGRSALTELTGMTWTIEKEFQGQ